MVGQGSLKKDLFAVPKFGLSPRAAPAHLLAGLRPVTTANSGGARLQAIRILTQLDTVLRTLNDKIPSLVESMSRVTMRAQPSLCFLLYLRSDQKHLRISA